MSTVAKWFGFGKNTAFDDGVRAKERGDQIAALEFFRVCAASEPESTTRERAKSYIAGLLGHLAASDLQSRNFDSAVRRLEEATTLRPHFADLQLALGRAYRLSGDRQKGMKHVEEAIALNPNYGFALVWSGLLNLESGNLKQAQESIAKGLEADPRLAKGLSLADINLILAGESGAVDVLLTIEPKAEKDPAILADDADRLAKSRNFREAEELYRQALEIAPNYADIHCRYGQTLMELDELPLAIREFREAVTINPTYTEAQALLGIAFRRIGDEDEALKAFAAVLEVDPSHPIASQEHLYRVRS